MSPFEFVFTLAGLLLGLSLAEVLGGLAKAIKARRHAARTAAPPLSLGYLVPMLALFLMLDVAGFWTYAWTVREEIPPTYVTLVFGLLVIGLYYLAASWVFPEDLADRRELDSHYFEQKGPIFAIVFLCNLLAYAGRILLSGVNSFTHWTWASWFLVAAYFLLLLLATVVRSKRANTIVLALLLFLYASDALKLHCRAWRLGRRQIAVEGVRDCALRDERRRAEHQLVAQLGFVFGHQVRRSICITRS